MHIKRDVKKLLYLFVAKYFMAWSKLSLKRWNPRVIAVTGSVGKTTMLGLLEIELGKKAHYSHNANSAYGIAFDIVGLRGVTASRWRWLKLFLAVPWRSLFYRHHEDFYVVEIDSERPKEAGMIAKWLQPEATFWITVGNSHAVYYDDMVNKQGFSNVEEAIAHEFSMVARHTTSLVLIDETNELMNKYTNNLQAKVIGLNGQPDDYKVELTKTSFQIGEHNFTVNFPCPTELTLQLQMITKFMTYLEMPLITDLAEFKMPPGRSNYFKGIKGINLIDSTYNAHLLSMQSILDMYQALQVPNKWLVIGDMIEQGQSEATEHRKLANILQNIDVESIILVGARSNKHILPLLKEASVAKDVQSFIDTRDALKYIQNHISGKETILLKGSQYLEWVVEKLLADNNDVVKLARQEPAAIKRRQSRGLK